MEYEMAYRSGQIVSAALALSNDVSSNGSGLKDEWDRIWIQASDPVVWSRLRNEEAAAICMAGWHLCISLSDYAEGLRYVSAYLSREDCSSADPVTSGNLRSMCGICRLYLSDHERGILDFRLACSQGDQSEREAQKIMVKNYVCAFLEGLGQEEAVPLALSTFALETYDGDKEDDISYEKPVTAGRLTRFLCGHK